MVNQIFLNYLDTISDCLQRARKRRLQKEVREEVMIRRATAAAPGTRVRAEASWSGHAGPAPGSHLRSRPQCGGRRAGAPLLRGNLVRALSPGRAHGRSAGPSKASRPAAREARLRRPQRRTASGSRSSACPRWYCSTATRSWQVRPGCAEDRRFRLDQLEWWFASARGKSRRRRSDRRPRGGGRLTPIHGTLRLCLQPRILAIAELLEIACANAAMRNRNRLTRARA